MNAKALAFTEGSRGMLSRTNFFLKKWGGGEGEEEGLKFPSAQSPYQHVLRTLALIKAKTFFKQVAIGIRKYELHFDIPWDTYWEYLRNL